VQVEASCFSLFPVQKDNLAFKNRVQETLKPLQRFSVVQFFSTTKPLHNKAAATFFSSPFALFLGRVSFPVYYASACPRLTWG
jgi:hypothetical protein